MPISRWRLAGVLTALLVLLGAAPAGAVGPAFHADDAAAPGGRFVVFWRAAAPARVSLPGVTAVRAGGDARRTTLIAEAGKEAAVAAALRRDPRVAAVVPDAVVHLLGFPVDPPDDTFYPDQTDLPQIHVPDAWKRTTGDPRVVVAFIDSGYDLGHPDLEGVNVVAPRNETFNSTEVNDVVGHGTHTSGTVFARANNGIGVAGIAPDATLMPIKILDGDGSGFFSDLLDGVDWARTHGADIISMSVGAWLDSDQVAAFQPTFSAARAAGILLVAAAGNSGTITRSFPAALNGVLAVGAVDSHDVVADFSTRNSSVDISAPGVETLSTGIDDPSGYERMSGTSMATPHVAGVAALVWSARPTLTADELETVLRESATDLGAPGRDDQYGAGRVDALAALDAPVPAVLPNLDPPPPPPAEPFTLDILAPAANVRQVARSYTVRVATNHEPSDAVVERAEWRIVGGRCPAEDTDPDDVNSIPYAAEMVQADLAPGVCYRWAIAAIDQNDEIVRAISPAVWIRDVTRPWVSARSPHGGATRVALRPHVTVGFSESVDGVSSRTVRLRNLATGRIVKATVAYSPDDAEAVLVPAARLARGTLYEVIVGGRIRDQSNNLLLPTRWVFRTRP